MSPRLVSVLVSTATTAAASLIPIAGAHADILWNNGSLVTNPGAGFGGADVSQCSSHLIDGGHFGQPSTKQTASRVNQVADDFTVGAGGWSVGSVTGYCLLPTTPATTPVTGCLFQIWDGAPTSDASSGTVIASSTSITSNVWSGIYRTAYNNLAQNSAPVWAVTADFTGLTLAPGSYWVSFNFITSPVSGYTPYVMSVDQGGSPVTVTGNGRNIFPLNSGWQQTIDGDEGFTQTVEYPFIINGTSTPAPGAATLLGMGGLLTARRRRVA